MAKIKIVTDSSCTIDMDLCEKLDIKIVPLSVMVDGTLYTDDENLTGEQFMEMMESAKSLPKTSQPPIGLFAELYDELAADGSTVISIHMNKILSGTVDAARQAAQISNAEVTVLDSEFTDQGLAFQVIRAAEMAQQDASKEEIVAAINKIKENTRLYVGVANLDNLVKGGRVSRVAGLISSVLNMRVIMELLPDELVVKSKGRGVKAFYKWFDSLKDELMKLDNVKQIAISHADGLDIANYFKDALEKMFPEMKIPVLHTNCVVSTHTGKGAFALMYYTE